MPGAADRLDLLRGRDERVDQGRRVARTRVLHRHAHDGACAQVDRMLGGAAASNFNSQWDITACPGYQSNGRIDSYADTTSARSCGHDRRGAHGPGRAEYR